MQIVKPSGLFHLQTCRYSAAAKTGEEGQFKAETASQSSPEARCVHTSQIISKKKKKNVIRKTDNAVPSSEKGKKTTLDKKSNKAWNERKRDERLDRSEYKDHHPVDPKTYKR